MSGLTGVVNRATVTLSNLTHSFSPDLDVLLVGPNGRGVVLMADAGAPMETRRATLVFDDAATAPPPAFSQLVSGTYQPASQGSPGPFGSTAPPPPYDTALAAFNGINPNGLWRLFVWDDATGDSGVIDGGWSLTLAAAVIPSLSIADASVAEGDTGWTNLVFTVNLWPPGSQTVSVEAVTTNGTAIAGGDYWERAETLSFPPGVTARQFSVPIPGDLASEPDKRFYVRLQHPANAVLARAQAEGTIIDNDPPPALSVAGLEIAEGNSGITEAVFTVTLEGFTEQTVTVDFYTLNATAAAPGDFMATNGALVFAPGAFTQTIRILIKPDTEPEPDEFFFLVLTNPANASLSTAAGRGTILNDDRLPGELNHFTVQVEAGPVWVGQPFPVTITAEDAFNQIVTNYAGPANLSGWTGPSLLITELDGADGVAVEFENAAPAALDLSGWQMTLYDADSWPAPRLAFTIPAGTLCRPGEVFLLRDAAPFPGQYPAFNTGTNLAWTDDPTIAVLVRDAAGNRIDFVCLGGANPVAILDPVEIPAGSWQGPPLAPSADATRTYQRIGNTDHQDASDWVLALPNLARPNPGLSPFPAQPAAVVPAGPLAFSQGVWTGAVTPLAPAAGLFLAIDDGAGHAGASRALSALLKNDLAISMVSASSTPVVDRDWALTLVVSNTGPAAVAEVTLTDLLPEQAQLMSVIPSQGSWAATGGGFLCQLGALAGGASATVAMVCRPGVPGPITNTAAITHSGPDAYSANNSAQFVAEVVLPQLTIQDATAAEHAGYALFTVGLAAPVQKTVRVDYATGDGTAAAHADYLPISGSLAFAPGVTNQTIVVEILQDAFGEPVEHFAVILSRPVNATLARAQATGSILDDDPPPNDHFSQRTPILSLPATLPGFNARATLEPGEPTAVAGSNSCSVWWTWTAEFSGKVTLNSLGSDFDHALAVYTGGFLPSLTLLAADHGSAGADGSQITFEAVAGTAYQIAAYGWNGAFGNLVLNLHESAAAPVQPIAAPRPDFWDADGPIYSMLATNGRLYLGGAFTYVAPKGPKLLSLDLFTGEAEADFPAIYGSLITAVIEDGQGGWFIAGNFQSAGGHPRTNLVHILSDYSVDTQFHPDPNDTVRALVIAGGTLYVGGDFVSIGGQRRRRLAAIELATGTVTPWNPEANDSVRDLAVTGNIVYAGGYFTQIGYQPRNNLAALDASTGLALDWAPQADGAVLSLALDQGQILVGGAFNRIGGKLRNRLAAIDLATGQATGWDPNPDSGEISMVRIVCDTVYVAGQFSRIGQAPRQSVAALDFHSGLATGWNAGLLPLGGDGLPARVHGLVISGNTIFLAGEFRIGGAEPRRDLAAVDALTGRVLPWNPELDGGFNALAVSGRKVLAGALHSPGGVPRRNLAAFDLVTGRATDWNPNADGPVFALAHSGETLYVGGGFTNLGGLPRSHLAAVNADSGLPSTWAPAANDAVLALAVSGNQVFVGGRFTQINHLPRNRIAAIVTSGEVTPWAPQADGSVHALAVSGSTVYAGGGFTYIGGQTRPYLAALDASSGFARDWNPRPDALVRALAVFGEVIYAGGSFTRIGAAPRMRLAAVDAASAQPLAWMADADADVRALAVAGKSLFVGGDFTSLGDLPRGGYAALEAVSGELLNWNPGRTGRNRMFALAAATGAVFAGGTEACAYNASPIPRALAVFPPIGAPIITRPPSNQEVGIREGFALETAVSGQMPLSYQWLFNGEILPGAIQATYASPTNTLPNQPGTYTLLVSNALGAVTVEAKVTVLEPVKITVHPSSQSFLPGQSLTLNVAATGSPRPIYQWRINGVNIPGAVYTTLSISNAQPTDGGTYSVVAANRLGAEYSRPAMLTPNSPVLDLADALNDRNLIGEPSGYASGNNVSATREPAEPRHAGKPGGKSVWLGWRAPANGLAVWSTRGSDFDTLLAVYTGSTIENLTLVASDEDQGGYLTAQVAFNAVQGVEYLIAIDGFAGASGNILLNWNLELTSAPLPRIIEPPQSQAVAEGQSAAFAVLAADPAPLSYQWLRNCREIPGATNATLVINEVRWSDIGPYRVRVMNARGLFVESPPAYLEIGPQPDTLSQDKLEDLLAALTPEQAPSQIQLASASGSVAAGYISVPLGTPVSQSYVNNNSTGDAGNCGSLGGASQYLGFIPQENGVARVDTIGSTFDTVLGVYTTNGLFSVALLACDDNGAPDRVRSVVRLNVVKGKAYLAVVDGIKGAKGSIQLNCQLGRAPAGTVTPQIITADAGGALVLSAGVTNAVPAPVYQWRWNGSVIPGATNAELVLPYLDAANAGTYSVVAKNFAGSITNTCAVLTVHVPLTFEEFGPLSDGRFRLRLNGNAGQNTLLQVSTNLIDWDNLLPGPVSTFPIYLTDTNAVRFNPRFYRAVVP